MPEAYIVDAVRTPTGRKKGSLSGMHPADLGAHTLTALMDRTGIDPAAVEAATGEAVDRMVFVFLNDDGPVEVELPDLAAAIAEVRAGTAELAEASAVSEAVVEFE